MKGLPIKRLTLESFLLALVSSVVSLTLPAITHSIPMGAFAQTLQYYRIQLKHNGKYLDANSCTDQVRLFDFVNNGACQLWRLVPADNGYNQIQLKYNGKYLDANFCTDQVRLFDFVNNGACQLWRLVPAGNGYYRIQLKYNGKYLDANFCTDQVRLLDFINGSDNGACQTWQLIPENIN
ncbi:RICIN domain-containing protein [Nostoc sp. CHAB 5824]|nr:RICIN domain-containing protein [Nostoc sp. CHAB 5824]